MTSLKAEALKLYARSYIAYTYPLQCMQMHVSGLEKGRFFHWAEDQIGAGIRAV